MRLLSKLNVPKYLRYQQSRCINSHTEVKDANNKHFEKVAQMYNEFNEVVSLGLHSKWRKAIIDNVYLSKDSQILDAPGGTGLNTIRLLEKTKHFEPDSKFQVTVFDISPHMLTIAQNDCKKLGYNPKFVKFVEGDLQKLPFANESFDTAIISFGIRGTMDFNMMFGEMHRVLKAKGKLLVFDFCTSQNPTIVQRLYFNYIQRITPIIERIKWGDLEAAKYVVDEIRDTLGKIDIEGIMKDTNFQNIEFKSFSLGIVVLRLTRFLKIAPLKKI